MFFKYASVFVLCVASVGAGAIEQQSNIDHVMSTKDCQKQFHRVIRSAAIVSHGKSGEFIHLTPTKGKVMTVGPLTAQNKPTPDQLASFKGKKYCDYDAWQMQSDD